MRLSWIKARPYLLGALLGVVSMAFGVAETGSRVHLLVQDSPLAGSQFHQLDSVQADIAEGDVLELVRESDNPHDEKAIGVLWRGRMLGYVPRKENRVVANALDRGETLSARVTKIQTHRNPWLRLRFAIYAEL
jgi:hypothetical protein